MLQEFVYEVNTENGGDAGSRSISVMKRRSVHEGLQRGYGQLRSGRRTSGNSRNYRTKRMDYEKVLERCGI